MLIFMNNNLFNCLGSYFIVNIWTEIFCILGWSVDDFFWSFRTGQLTKGQVWFYKSKIDVLVLAY